MLFYLASSAGVMASIWSADVVLLNNVGDDGRRGDLMLPQCGEDRKNLLLDFTITNPVRSMDGTIHNPGSSIEKANKRKNNKYLEAAVASDITSMLMAIECYGALSLQR
jgi:hypothetical protein